MSVTEKQIREGKNMFESFCRFLDSQNFKYQRIKDGAEDGDGLFMLKYGIRGDDIPMDFYGVVSARHETFVIKSPQPVEFAAEQLPTAALAICAINDSIFDGSYSLDISDGSVMFNITTMYGDSLIADSVFERMMGVSTVTVDEYNDKLLMLGKGLIDFESFLKAI